MLRMIAEVDSPALKACFDAPLAHMQGVSDMRAAAAEVGPLQVLSHFGGEYNATPTGGSAGLVWHSDGSRTPERFYAEFLRGMVDIGYKGFIGYELCHPLPKVDGKPAGLDFAESATRSSRPNTCTGCSPRSRHRRLRTRRNGAGQGMGC